MKNNLIRVAIVDDQMLIRHGLSYIIKAQEDMEVVGEAANGHEAVNLVKSTVPHVVLMDVQMPEKSGIEATREILTAFSDIKVVILTTFDLEEYVYDGIRSGAVGYLLKDATPDELIDAIRAAYRGEAIFRTSIAAKVMAKAIKSANEDVETNKAKIEMFEMFTERELEVLQQMAFGLKNEEISKVLHISESTVKTHVHRILQKIGAEDRTQAVVYAIRNRIVL
ncbi:LuxR family transcriptional regulator [Lysinibacillus sp. FJAT-14745]|uniref:response regulator transcription factor n=1 Tax=Lysinibacillus sp. FJAT-14745 TaxID=1704289 RepID=UPI0006AB9731|nr:response regulator transcription factor [Lysinibacillus sp. FJAT-14745]KOP80521.1 LuxR family transcriptional regulator [Lysinibacillus sp. FJAT-14745]